MYPAVVDLSSGHWSTVINSNCHKIDYNQDTLGIGKFDCGS